MSSFKSGLLPVCVRDTKRENSNELYHVLGTKREGYVTLGGVADSGEHVYMFDVPRHMYDTEYVAVDMDLAIACALLSQAS